MPNKSVLIGVQIVQYSFMFEVTYSFEGIPSEVCELSLCKTFISVHWMWRRSCACIQHQIHHPSEGVHNINPHFSQNCHFLSLLSQGKNGVK